MLNLDLEFNLGRVARLLAVDVNGAAQFEPRLGKNRPSIGTGKVARILLAVVEQINRSGANIVHANAQAEKFAFSPNWG